MAAALLTKGATPRPGQIQTEKNGGKVVNAVLLLFEGFQPPFRARRIAQPRFSPQTTRGPLQANAPSVLKAYDTGSARESLPPSRSAIAFRNRAIALAHRACVLAGPQRCIKLFVPTEPERPAHARPARASARSGAIRRCVSKK